MILEEIVDSVLRRYSIASRETHQGKQLSLKDWGAGSARVYDPGARSIRVGVAADSPSKTISLVSKEATGPFSRMCPNDSYFRLGG